ncbi:MAG: hypothetical protein AAF236_17425 [Verrucomicrobiota bacterium]
MPRPISCTDARAAARREVIDIDARVAVALQWPHPFFPHRIDEYIEAGRANEEAGVPDPDDFDLIRMEGGEDREGAISGRLAASHERGEEAAAEVAIVPPRPASFRS